MANTAQIKNALLRALDRDGKVTTTYKRLPVELSLNGRTRQEVNQALEELIRGRKITVKRSKEDRRRITIRPIRRRK